MSKIGEETISVTPSAIVKMSDKTYQVRMDGRRVLKGRFSRNNLTA